MNWHYKQNELASCVTALLTTVQKLLSFEDLYSNNIYFFQYYEECHGVIYVVDSSDQRRMEESHQSFSK